MLSEFLQAHRADLIERCRSKAAKRNNAAPITHEYGIPDLISQLVDVFRIEETRLARRSHSAKAAWKPSVVPSEIPASAARHGDELRRHGLTVDQVVHDYGDLCQALTELAMEMDEPIAVHEFHTFNRCLDDAIAEAVTAFAGGHSHPIPRGDAGVMDEKPQSVGQQIRDLLTSASLSFAAIRSGQVGLKGTTSALHEKSLTDLRDLLDLVLRDPNQARDSSIRAGP